MTEKNMAQFSIRDQLVFYGSYHSNPINVAIHTVFIPIILWSSQALLAKLPTPAFFDGIAPTYEFRPYFILAPNWAVAQTIFGLGYYALLDPVATLLFIPQAITLLATATAFAERADTLLLALGLHVAAWIAQFLGHGLAEKREPALMDNLAAALLTAPFFVHFEILFYFGYRPALYREVQKDVKAEVERFRVGNKLGSEAKPLMRNGK